MTSAGVPEGHNIHEHGDYIVLTGRSSLELEIEVCNLLMRGYLPMGGVSCTPCIRPDAKDQSDYPSNVRVAYFVQAMYKAPARAQEASIPASKVQQPQTPTAPTA